MMFAIATGDNPGAAHQRAVPRTAAPVVGFLGVDDARRFQRARTARFRNVGRFGSPLALRIYFQQRGCSAEELDQIDGAATDPTKTGGVDGLAMRQTMHFSASAAFGGL